MSRLFKNSKTRIVNARDEEKSFRFNNKGNVIKSSKIEDIEILGDIDHRGKIVKGILPSEKGIEKIEKHLDKDYFKKRSINKEIKSGVTKQ